MSKPGQPQLRSVFNSINNIPFRDVTLGIFLWTLSLLAVFGLLALLYLTITRPFHWSLKEESATNAQPAVQVVQKTSYPTASIPALPALAYPFSNGGFAESLEPAQAGPQEYQEVMEDL